MASPADYLKLGLRAEYLRGISSVSIQRSADLQNYPILLENDPYRRYAVHRVVENLDGFLKQLGEMRLTKSAEAAEPLRPMLKEMQTALQQSAQPNDVILRDPWASRFIENIRSVVAVLEMEVAK
jgi:hypothetical protein